jgi:chlorobactene glucosyltransferase
MFLVIVIISLSLFTVISVYNLFTAPILKIRPTNSQCEKLVSVLVPARNEETNISKCIDGIINQDYPNKEIIILDDNSTDKTFEIASSINSDNLNILKGKELPSDWLGKNWACNQLSSVAKGDYLLFIDSDVTLKPSTISSAVYAMNTSNATLISIFPTQIIKSFGEYLIVPLMNWLLLAFLPLRFVYSSSNKSFVAANGQFMLWRKEDYLKLGGHQAVKDKIVEDMELAKLAKKNNFKVKTLLGGKLVYCRMYNSFNESYYGFQKNFYTGFSLNPVFFLIMIIFLLIVFVSPIILLSTSLYFILPVGLIVLVRLCISMISRQNVFINIALHPIQLLFMFWIGVLSVIKFKTNQLVWKQRKL